MEIKKSSKADLDGKRTQGFFMGVILVMSVLFVAMEYDWEASSSDYDLDALENIVKELDLEALKEEERIPLIKEQVVERPQSAEQFNVVEDEPQVELKDDEIAPPENDVELKTVDEAEDPEQPTVLDMENNPLNFRVVEELPEFPGGATEFMKWLTKNLRYPPAAQQHKVQGKVVVSFIVNADGKTSDVKVLTKVHPLLDREALRVIRMMPEWKPGEDKGKPCSTMIAIPVVFAL